MTPAPIGITPATSRPAAPAPTAPAAPAPTAPAAPAAPAPSTSSAPTSTATATATPASTAANQLVADIKTLTASAQGIDATWANGVLQARAAVEALGKDARLSAEAQSSLTRLMFIGKAMGMQVPKDFKATVPDSKLAPADVILAAEKAFQTQVEVVAKQAVAVSSRVPDGAPQEVAQLLAAIREHATDAMYAIKFSRNFAPPPAPPTQQQPAPAGTPARPAKASPQPAATH